MLIVYCTTGSRPCTVEPRDRSGSRHLSPHGRAPRAAHLHQDRCVDPRCGGAVRARARPARAALSQPATDSIPAPVGRSTDARSRPDVARSDGATPHHPAEAPEQEMGTMRRATSGQVSIHIDAPPEHVYDLVTDVTRMGEWSPETHRCRWVEGDGPAVGARFKGDNRRGRARWACGRRRRRPSSRRASTSGP